MLRKKIFLFYLILCLFEFSFSENPERIDSLVHIAKSEIGEKRINALCELGDIYKKSNPEKAFEYGEQALELSEKSNYKYGKAWAYRLIANYYHYKRDYEKALEYKDQYYALKDSVFAGESSKRIAELEVKYDTEKKEKRITIQNLEIKKKENQNLFLYIIASLVFIIAVIVICQYRIKIKINSELRNANQKLIESEENLKHINDSKDKLFSIISHDLKNPFGTLITVAEFLVESFNEISEDHKFKTIQTIRKSAKQTYELLENLAQWSISQSKQLRIFPVNFDIARTVATTITLVRFTAQKKSINVISEISDDTFVFADENYIKIVLRNLITNAIKFTGEFGKIKISAKSVKQQIEITVSDSGVGLIESDIEKLFRLDVNPADIGISNGENSKLMNEKGTGLGLIMCKEFVEKNGGRIWAESKFGVGSKFVFTLAKGR